MHTVLWKRQAFNDLARISEFIAQDSAANAEKLVELITSKALSLASHPQIGRIGRKSGTKELVVHEHYVVIYRVLSARVEILRVKHTAQRWP